MRAIPRFQNDRRVVRNEHPDDSVRERVFSFLVEHRDAQAAENETTVSSIRQETIASRVGLSLHEVIEAIDALRREGRIDVERQSVGNPNRYRIRDRGRRQESIAI